VRFTSFDGTYTESLTLTQARRSDVIVALRMQGRPITHDHGGPVRMYVAPMYGYKSTKWLSGIELTADVQSGYWEGRGYPVNGWIGR
jgi:DMSO/TMAO reductase YedYZ molybdopterin-dependent catalytic subunit